MGVLVTTFNERKEAVDVVTLLEFWPVVAIFESFLVTHQLFPTLKVFNRRAHIDTSWDVSYRRVPFRSVFVWVFAKKL